MAKNSTIPNHDNLTYFDRAKEVEQFDQTKAGVKGLTDSGISTIPNHELTYNRAKEVELFDQTKAGVKGLTDSGISTIPNHELTYNRAKEAEQFDQTKVGVKGLTDSGISTIPNHELTYNRAKEVELFDQTKAGVKGLTDSGISTIPRIFIHPPENLSLNGNSSHLVEFPVIDFEGGDSIMEEVREASETWGFFQVVNHGIPLEVMEELLEGIRRFHEQPVTEKRRFYTREFNNKVRYYSNGDLLVSRAANWRDSVSFEYQDGDLNSDELPLVCREAVTEYMENILRLKNKLSETMSMALGLDKEYLTKIECMETANLVCHYYPACPEPHLTLGATKHCDPSFMTILLQDNTGGLEVFHRDQWIDIQPRAGALLVHLGDLMQLITNAKFKSVEHRVRLRKNCPRVSAACFFYPSTEKKNEIYRPIETFLSEDNPPLYRGTSVTEYLTYYRGRGLDGQSALPHFEL